MRIYWYKCNVCIEPESNYESEFLSLLINYLPKVKIGRGRLLSAIELYTRSLGSKNVALSGDVVEVELNDNESI